MPCRCGFATLELDEVLKRISVQCPGRETVRPEPFDKLRTGYAASAAKSRDEVADMQSKSALKAVEPVLYSTQSRPESSRCQKKRLHPRPRAQKSSGLMASLTVLPY